MESSIPVIDIINENAVYDLYMRRLNRVWMRRLKASRAKARAHSNGPPRFFESRKLDARPISVPPFVREAPMLDEARRQERRRRPSSEAAAASQLGEMSTSTRSRPQSAPDVVNRPTASWAELRDRTHAATGPGPTSSRRRHHLGDNRASPTFAARPDSAPNRCRHPERDGAPAPRERPKCKQHGSVWLAPRVTRLERETNDLLTACNAAGRKEREAVRWTHGFSRQERTDAGAGIEDLGRGAVVRLIGNLGMGRYAHRFRAFAVTGSDLASCTERDLIQIGVDFRPHRLRLLSEIKRSKELRAMAAQRRHKKTMVGSSDELAPTAACNQEDALKTLKRPKPSAPALVVPGSPASSLSEDSSSQQQDQPDATGRTPDAQTRAGIDEPSSDATACTPYNNVAKHTHRPGSACRVSTSTQASASPRLHLSPEGKRAGHEISESVDQGEGGNRVRLPERDVSRSFPEANEGFDAQPRQLPGADAALIPLVTLLPATFERCSVPRLKGTLQVSSVRAGDVSIALGGSDPFVRVRTCDQLQRADLLTHKGVEASWRDTVLSFSVTDQALSSGGVQIELCDGGSGGEQEAIASGSIPGDVTFRLICSSRSILEGGNRCVERKRIVEAAENIHSGGCGDAVGVEVRLFAKIGGEDAGVCTLNLVFRPDVENHRPLPPGHGRQPELTTETLPHLEQETPGGLAALTSPDVAEIRQSSLALFEETARHIEAIKDVRRQHRQVVDQPDQGGGKPTGSTESEEGTGTAIAGRGAEMIAGQFLNRRRSIEEQKDAAVILQSHARRIAASNVVKRRVKVRTAANRVQAFARQRMGAYKIRQAREIELALMRRRDGAALRLQNTARRRLAVKATRKARAVHAERNKAAAHIQNFAKHRIRVNHRKHYAATKVKGIARVRGAKAEANQLQPKKLAATRRNEEENAALRIQQFSRQNMAYKRRLAHIEERRRAAVMMQTRNEEVGDTSPRSATKDTSAIGLRRSTTYMVEDRRQAAAKIQKLARTRAAAAKRAADATDIKRRNEAARRLQAYARRRQPPKIVEPASGESWIEADGGVNERVEIACHAPITLHSSGRNHGVMKEMQSFRQAEEAAAIAEQRVAVRRIQRGWRHRAAHRGDDRHAKVASPPVSRAGYALRVTPAVKVHGNNQEAAMCIQAAFRGWLLAREATLVGAQVETERRVGEAAPRMQCPSRVDEDEPQLVEVRCEGELAVQKAAQRDAATVIIKQRKAAVCIQRALRTSLAVDRVARLRREREDGIQRNLQLEAQAIAREAAAACIQRAVRIHHAVCCIAKLRRQRIIDIERELELEVCRGEAAACIQSLVRRKQVGGRVTDLRRQGDVETQRTVELELQQQRRSEREAATTIQRSVRKKQAGDRVAKMRRQHRLEARHRQELELGRRREVEREAAECIERTARRRLAVRRVKGLRHQRDAEVQRKFEESELERRVEAAACIQRATRSRQAVARVDKLTRQRNADIEQRRADLERKLHGAAVCIQSSARRKQAVIRVADMKRQRILEIRHKQEVELGRRREIEREAAECIQRTARIRQAGRRVKALRQQRDADVQRKLVERELERQTEAAACIQRATKSRQAVARVDDLRRQRDANIEQSRAELERKLHGAATCIQSLARRKQAVIRVTDMRRQRVLEIQHQQELELAHRREIEREAAECIQRAARRRQAVQRTKALRQQRDADVQRKLMESELERRAEAAACLQRATRSRQAVARVDDLRQQRDADIEQSRADLERKLHGAAVCIQSLARRKQAVIRVADMRRRRVLDIQHKRELELACRREIEREAAECIQRAARRRQAVQRAKALRQQRGADMQRKLMESELERRAEAAACIQRATRSRQAVARVNDLRRQRDADIERDRADLETRQHDAAVCIQRSARRKQAGDRVAEMRQQRGVETRHKHELELRRRREIEREATECIQRAARRRQAVQRAKVLRQQRDADVQRKLLESELERREEAAACIQRATRSRQAVARVDDLKRQQDADIEQSRVALETKQHGAAVCIQRSARKKQAGDRVAEMRQQYNVETRHKHELELRRRREVEREAAQGIQRAVRRRQAVQRVEDLRQQREADNMRKLKRGQEEQMLARTRAVLCIQRAVRCRQAVVRIASLRKQKDTGASRALEEAEIERQTVGGREQAATCIQRVVRRTQAIKRVSALREQGDIGIPRQVEEGLKRRSTTRQEASGRIQRAVRVRQAVKHVAGLRLQRSMGLRRRQIEQEQEQQERIASDEDRAVVILQRFQRQHTAVRRMQKLREERARREEQKLKEGGEEQKVESVASMFAKMMESARRRSLMGDGGEPFPPSLPIPERQTTLVDEAPNTLADSQADSPRNSRGFGDGSKGAFTDEGSGSDVDGNFDTSEEAQAREDANDSVEGTTPAREEVERHAPRVDDLRDYDSSETEGETVSSRATSDGGGSEVSDRSDFGEEPTDGRLPIVVNAADQKKPATPQDQHHTVPTEIHDGGHDKFHEDYITEDVLQLDVNRTSSTIVQGVRNDGEDSVSSSDNDESLRQPVNALGDTVPSSVSEAPTTPPEEEPLEADPSHHDGHSRDTEGLTAIVDSPAVQSNIMGNGPRSTVPDPSRRDAEEYHIPGDGVRPLDEGTEVDSEGESSTKTEESLDGWETHVDEGTGRVFYYHPESGVTSWDHPRGATDSTDEESQEEEDRELGAASADDDAPAPSSNGSHSINELSLADRDQSQYDTTEKRDANDGQQTATARDTSDTPVLSLNKQDREEATASGASVTNAEPKHEDLPLANMNANEVPAVDASSNAGEHQREEWQEVLDPETGSKYFYNPTTRQSTWALPENAKAAAATAADTNASTNPMGG